MTNKWANPAYSHVSPKTRPAHLPSNDLPKRIHTHMIRKQFDYHNPVQQPGSRVLDLFHNCIVVDTYLPKKMSDHFKAWVRDLKLETQRLHLTSDIIVYTDGTYHHADHHASFAVCKQHLQTWSNYTDWCPAASSFDAEIRTIEKAIELIVSIPGASHVHLFCDNKATANALFNFDVKSSQMVIIHINMLLSEWFSVNEHSTLHIRFVPSHLGIEGNECTDALTKTGLERCPMKSPTILQSHFINSYNSAMSNAWTVDYLRF